MYVIGGVVAAIVAVACALVLLGGGEPEDVAARETGASSTTAAAAPASTTTTRVVATTTTTGPTTSTTAAPASTTTTATPTTVAVPLPAPVDQARLDALLGRPGGCVDFEGELPGALVRSVFGDVDGDGVTDGLATIECSAGGTFDVFEQWVVLAARPDAQFLRYGEGLESRFELDLYDVRVGGGVVTLDVGAAHGYDPHCCSSLDVRETYEWDGEGLARTTRVLRDAESSTAEVVAGDTSGATPEVAAAIADAVHAHGALQAGGPCGLAAGPGYACAVTLADGTPATLTWDRAGFLDWRAVGFALDSP